MIIMNISSWHIVKLHTEGVGHTASLSMYGDVWRTAGRSDLGGGTSSDMGAASDIVVMTDAANARRGLCVLLDMHIHILAGISYMLCRNMAVECHS
jgi:hypothetical protein